MSTSDSPVQVLLSYENHAERKLLEKTFGHIEDPTFELEFASSERNVPKHLKQGSLDLVILSYTPTDNGELNVERLNFIRNLRLDHPNLPLLTITSQGNERVASELIRAGSDDYRSLGEITPFTLNESIRYVRRYRDEQHKLRRTARMDSLTGLDNREQTLNLARDAMQNASRHGRSVFLVLLDLDNFKEINDTFGHISGDRILQQVAEILSEEIRAGDTAGRYGGDEFILLLTETDPQGARRTVDRILSTIEEHTFTITGDVEVPVSLTCSAGLTEFSGEDFEDERPLEDLNGIISRADQALQHAEANGGNRVEQRRYERIPVRTFPIQISYGSHRHDAELLDYSHRGLRLRFEPLEELPSTITVSFETKQPSRVKRDGRVQWCVDDPSTQLVLVGLAVDVPIYEMAPLPQPEEDIMDFSRF